MQDHPEVTLPWPAILVETQASPLATGPVRKPVARDPDELAPDAAVVTDAVAGETQRPEVSVLDLGLIGSLHRGRLPGHGWPSDGRLCRTRRVVTTPFTGPPILL